MTPESADPLAHVRHLLGADDTDLVALLEYVEAHCAARGHRLQIRPHPGDTLEIKLQLPADPEAARRHRARLALALSVATHTPRPEPYPGTSPNTDFATMARNETMAQAAFELSEAVRQQHPRDLGAAAPTPDEIEAAERWLAEQLREGGIFADYRSDFDRARRQRALRYDNPSVLIAPEAVLAREEDLVRHYHSAADLGDSTAPPSDSPAYRFSDARRQPR